MCVCVCVRAQAHSSATGNHPIHNVHVEVCYSCMYHFICLPPLPSIGLNALWNGHVDGAAVICSSLEHVHQEYCIACLQRCAFITYG